MPLQLSMSGSLGGPLGPLVADLAAGAILGAGAVATAGFSGVLIAHSLGSRRRVKVQTNESPPSPVTSIISPLKSLNFQPSP